MLTDLPDDMILEITLYLPTLSLIRFLSSSKKMWNLRHRRYPNHHGQQSLQTFLDLLRYHTTLKDWQSALTASLKQNCLECTDHFIKKLDSSLGINWNRVLEDAAEFGNMKLIQLAISKGADYWNNALRTAAKGGHEDIVNFLIENGASEWNEGLYGASYGGHQDLVEFFHQKGAHDWENAAKCAAIGGKMELMEYFVDHGYITLIHAMDFSFNKETAKFLLKHGPHKASDVFLRATRLKQLEVIETFLNLRPDLVRPVLNEALAIAAGFRFRDLVEYLVSKGANDFNRGLIAAANTTSNNTQLVHYFIEKGATDWNGALCAAIPNECHRDLIDLFIQKGANNWDEAIRTAHNVEEWTARPGYIRDLLELFAHHKAKRRKLY